jgi:hypothetical protein
MIRLNCDLDGGAEQCSDLARVRARADFGEKSLCDANIVLLAHGLLLANDRFQQLDLSRAAVYKQINARHVTAIVRRKEENRFSNFIRGAGSAKRDGCV